MKRDVAEALIVNEKNEILLQKKTRDYKFAPGGFWTVFGGEIKDGESPEQALRREIKEEINYDAKQLTLFKICDYELPQNGVEGRRYIFIVRFHGSVSQISLSEGCGFGFFSAGELDSLKIQRMPLDDLKEYFKSDGHI